MIYAIQARGTDFVKVGRTTRGGLRKRLDAMQTGCPMELCILGLYAGGREQETVVHHHLRVAGKHVRGEWFRYDEQTAAILSKLMPLDAEVRPKTRPVASAHRRLSRALAWQVAA